MRRALPILPTLIVAAAVAVMVYLGIWQLQRAGWKERMLIELAAAPALPPVDLAVLPAKGDPAVAFRRVRVTCSGAAAVQPAVRAGRNRDQRTGFSYFVPCFPEATEGWRQRLEVNIGWASRPDVALTGGSVTGRMIEGLIGTVEPGNRIILTATEPLSPLEASAPPAADQIPDNHLAYAVQWFLFAAAAAIIYALALRRQNMAGGADAPPATSDQ